MDTYGLPTVVKNESAYSSPDSPALDERSSLESPGGRPLDVKDALSYLEMIKVKCEDKPEVYKSFLEITKDFKGQVIDTPGVINQVSELSNDHTIRIQGFNTFLPQGYRIDCNADQHGRNLITVTTPLDVVTTLSAAKEHIDTILAFSFVIKS